MLNISETVKARTKQKQKCIMMTFIDVDMHHRVTPMQMYSDLDLHFQGKTFSCQAFAIKISNTTDLSPADFPRLAPPLRWSCLSVPTNRLDILVHLNAIY